MSALQEFEVASVNRFFMRSSITNSPLESEGPRARTAGESYIRNVLCSDLEWR
jgi:hypothetical protein